MSIDGVRWITCTPANPQGVSPSKTTSPAPAAQASPSATKDSVALAAVYTVKQTDSLWNIAKNLTGDPTKWTQLYDLNSDHIYDPNLIFPGTQLQVPPSWLKAAKPTKTEKPGTAGKPEKPVEQTKPAAKPQTPAPASQKPSLTVVPGLLHSDLPGSQKPQTAAPQAPASQAQAQPQYPTVGEYVKKRFNDDVDSTLTGLHGAGELAFPPLLLGEIAAIKAKHEKKAIDRIWDLPMDPQGNWKKQASRISDQESAAANAEIRKLPGVRAIAAAGDAIGDGVNWTGRQIKAAGTAVVDGVETAGVAVGQGVEWTGRQIENGTKAARHGVGGMFVSIGKWISGN
jgi:hypothetical protein